MPQLRKDPITGRWVIIATERAARPTDFIREPVVPQSGRICPFCPGNEDRTPPELLAYRNGQHSSSNWSLRVIPNKFPALRVEGSLDSRGDGIYDRMNGVGAHEVFIESPDHYHTLAEAPETHLEQLFWAYRERVLDLRKDRRLVYVLLFKNHGEVAGATLDHTHSQLIALPVVPKRVQEEMDGALRHYEYRGRCIYCDILAQEVDDGSRVVLDTEHFLAFSPYAPRFPFETLVLPKRHASHFEATEDAGLVKNLAWVTRLLLRKFDKLLERPAYNLVLHSAPVQDGPLAHYHWHLEITPKLTRIAGFETGTGFYINPTSPEQAAHYMREAGMP